ncbi:hypothetical protein LXA43DRAFT_1069124 [Ganoderma leucocontextum]|nr:hypothetical protein LXA43DRAFT_1069124 [Ganoderma leucocontextum]
MQADPTEEALEGIEALRDGDQQVQHNCDDAKAHIQASKKAAKERKAHERAAKMKNAPLAKDMHSNIKKECPLTADHMKSKTAASRDGPIISQGKWCPFGAPCKQDAPAPYEQDAPAKNPVACIVLMLLWEKANEEPFIERVSVPFGDDIYLYHYPRVYAIPCTPPVVPKIVILYSRKYYNTS